MDICKFQTELLLMLFFICTLIPESKESSCQICLESSSCLPPDCSCCGERMPLKTKDNIPQMVFFTFDDAITSPVADFYRTLFNSEKRNPNGCPIRMTLFVSHTNTNYNLVKEFYDKGMEIAAHSVTHNHMNESNFREEALKQKENIAREAMIPVSAIKGWRSPYLEPVGDIQPKTLKELDYTYDATLTVGKKNKYAAPTPFTLDYGWPYECKIKPCPVRSHPKFWEVPVVTLRDYVDKFDCVYVDGCNNPPPNANAAFDFLWNNFNTYYNGNRAPFGVNMHASWFFYPERFAGMEKFIQELLKLKDVYIVSASQVIDWFKNPTYLDSIENLDSWECDESQKMREEQRRIEEKENYERELRERLEAEVKAREKASIGAYLRAKEEQAKRLQEEREQAQREKEAQERALRIHLAANQRRHEQETLYSTKKQTDQISSGKANAPKRKISSTVLWDPSKSYTHHGLIGVPISPLSKFSKTNAQISQPVSKEKFSNDFNTNEILDKSLTENRNMNQSYDMSDSTLVTEAPITTTDNERELMTTENIQTTYNDPFPNDMETKTNSSEIISKSDMKKHNNEIANSSLSTTKNSNLKASMVQMNQISRNRTKLPSTLQLLRMLGWLHTHVASGSNSSKSIPKRDKNLTATTINTDIKKAKTDDLTTRQADQSLSEWVSDNRPVLKNMLYRISSIINKNAKMLMRAKSKQSESPSGNQSTVAYNHPESIATETTSNNRSLNTLPTTKGTTPFEPKKQFFLSTEKADMDPSVSEFSHETHQNEVPRNPTSTPYFNPKTDSPFLETQAFIKQKQQVTMVNPYGISLDPLAQYDYKCFTGRICQQCTCDLVPNGLSKDKIPQFIVISIESAVNFVTYSKIMSIFRKQRVNPNNCPITGTIFVKDNNFGLSNNRLLKTLSAKGMEVGILVPKDIDMGLHQYIRQRRQEISADSNIDKERIKGIRIVNEKLLQMLDYDFMAKNQMYDSSLVSDDPSWPTVFKSIDSNCSCFQSETDVAEISLTPILSKTNSEECLYADMCNVPPSTILDTFQMLKNNFDAHYSTDRKPLGIHLTDNWFDMSNQHSLAGLSRFLDKMLQYEDVFIISQDKLLDWTKSPSIIVPPNC